MVQRLNKLCEICQRVTRECTDNYEDITRRPKSWMQSDNPLEGEDHDCTTHINDWLFSIPYRHHDNINMLEQSAARGCHFCTMLKLHLSTKGSLNETLPIFVRHDINPRNRAWNVAIHEFKIEIAVFFHGNYFPNKYSLTFAHAQQHQDFIAMLRDSLLQPHISPMTMIHLTPYSI